MGSEMCIRDRVGRAAALASSAGPWERGHSPQSVELLRGRAGPERADGAGPGRQSGMDGSGWPADAGPAGHSVPAGLCRRGRPSLGQPSPGPTVAPETAHARIRICENPYHPCPSVSRFHRTRMSTGWTDGHGSESVKTRAIRAHPCPVQSHTDEHGLDGWARIRIRENPCHLCSSVSHSTAHG